MRRCLLCFSLMATLAVYAPAQNAKQTASPLTANPSVANPTLPTVSFDCLWDAATPQSYTITVQSTGSAIYVSSNPKRPPDTKEEWDDTVYQTEFTLSAANRDKIFHLAEQSGYFNGNFDYRKHVVANTGKKTLTYADPARHFQTTYNWSENATIDQLTRIFQGISATVEHGRKLQFLRRFDKLGLEAELKGMEDLVRDHNMEELQIIAPLLKSLADDFYVMNIARQRARRLLEQSKEETNAVKPSQ